MGGGADVSERKAGPTLTSSPKEGSVSIGVRPKTGDRCTGQGLSRHPRQSLSRARGAPSDPRLERPVFCLTAPALDYSLTLATSLQGALWSRSPDTCAPALRMLLLWSSVFTASRVARSVRYFSAQQPSQTLVSCSPFKCFDLNLHLELVSVIRARPCTRACHGERRRFISSTNIRCP